MRAFRLSVCLLGACSTTSSAGDETSSSSSSSMSASATTSDSGGDESSDGSTSGASTTTELTSSEGPAESDTSTGGTAAETSGGSESTGAACEGDPSRVLFIGNSFTAGYDVTGKFRDLAVSSAFPEPVVEVRALGGATLESHRADAGAAGAPALVAEGWDVVVLQEQSVRPTDAVGDPAQFKLDATWFYDRAYEANNAGEVVLYETWAWHPDHPNYPSWFSDPADMQSQLRFHYFDAAESYIPGNAESPAPFAVSVAPAGDAFEQVIEMGEPVRVHDNDDAHQNAAGAYLSALVLFGTIYDRRTEGLAAIDVTDEEAAVLQAIADAITGAEMSGGPIDCGD